MPSEKTTVVPGIRASRYSRVLGSQYAFQIDGYPMRAPFLLARAFSCYAHAYSA